MKKTAKSILITLVICLTLNMPAFSAMASEPIEASGPADWNEIRYETINEITVSRDAAVGDDTTFIQEALNQAIGADETVLTQITIPEGVYTTNGSLYIYSNTRLILEEGTEIIRSDNWHGGDMLMSGDGSANANNIAVGGYDAIHNVFIEGGTWNANRNLADHDFANILVITHANNIIFNNITITDAVNHMINISGSNKVLIDNCTFKDAQVFTGDDRRFYDSGLSEEDKIARHCPIEAIHMDFMNEIGEGGGPAADGTPCNNITVRNCTFDNVFRGLGTHHTISSSPNDQNYAIGYADKIIVENNTFNNIRATCISAYSFNNMIIKNNTATNVGSFCDFNDAHNSLIIGNTITGTVTPDSYTDYVNVFSPIFLQTSSGITITGNAIKSDDKIHSNIMITESSSNIAIDSNILSGSNTTCIYIKDSDGIVINNISEEHQNAYATNGNNELYVENASVTVGHETFNKNIMINQSAAVISNCTLEGGYIHLLDSHGATIRDNTINTTDNSITACILIDRGDDDIMVSGNDLSTDGNNCIYVNNMSGHDVSISGNTFMKSSKYLVYVSDSNEVTISDNTMNNTSAPYRSSIGVSGSNVNISNNIIGNYTEAGITIKGTSTATIDGNTISGGVNALQIYENSNVSVTNNNFGNTSSHQINAVDSTGRFENNTISDSGSIGICFSGCRNLTVNGNSISNTNGHGMYLDNVNTATISNNTFSNIPEWKCRVRVTDNCVNVTVTPESDMDFITPVPTQNPVADSTTTPTPAQPPATDSTTTPTPVQNPAADSTTTPEPTPTTPAGVTVVPTPEDSDTNGVSDFVERLYTVALGRRSDPVGQQQWVDTVTSGQNTGADLARGFLYSDEFLNKNCSNTEFVQTLYRTFFGREADEGGLAAWVGVLDGGENRQNVIEGFINSTEWANLCLSYGIPSGGTGTPSIEVEPNQATIDFATRLYTTCLNRNADQGGLMAWAHQLANQRDTGTGAARGFFFSEEFTGQNVDNGEYVARLYRTFMGREPDQAGYDAWVGQLDSGISREEVFNGFAQSVEFTRICASYGIIR